MPDEFKFGLRLTIDNKDLTVGVGLAEKDIKRLARVIKEAAGPTGRTTRAIRNQTAALRKNRGAVSQAVDAFRKLTQANQRTGRSFAQAHGHHLKYIAALIEQARNALRLADSYTDLSNRLRLVTDSEQELIATREQLLAVSLNTRTALDANAALFAVGVIDENTSASTALAGALNTVADSIKGVGLGEFSEELNIARQAGTASAHPDHAHADHLSPRRR